MSTNFYLQKPLVKDAITELFDVEPTCIHIGKRSAGWAFLFRGHEGVVASYDGWSKIIKDAIIAGWKLVDEYGRPHSHQLFFEIVNNSGMCNSTQGDRMQTFEDDDGWEFTFEEFC